MFFRKAKRIKELENWLDVYARDIQRTRFEWQKNVRNLSRSAHEETLKLRDERRLLVAAMISTGIKRLNIDYDGCEKAKGYRLRHVVNPLTDTEWLEVEEISPLP